MADVATDVTSFREVLNFFGKIGVYDVVLPFLLVFTIVFAIFEKTKLFGTEKIGDREYTKKNLNAMVAFVMGFFVVASAKLVDILTVVSANTVILLMLSVFFLLLVGSFYKQGEGVFLEGSWKTFFMIIMFVGIVLIFLDALGWLDEFWAWTGMGTGGSAVGSVILIVLIVVFMWYIVRSPNPEKNGSK